MPLATKRLYLFDIVNYIFFTILCIVMIYPFWHTMIGSFMTFGEYTNTRFLLIPRKPTLIAYKQIFEEGDIYRPLVNTVLMTAIHTVTAIFSTSYVAYGLSKKVPGQRVMMFLFIVTMYFNAGLIPTYILFKQLHVLNTYMVYIVPSLIGVWNLIIFRSVFISFDQNLIEAAKIDGYSEFYIFLKIVLPLSKATLAALALFAAVGMWNNLFTSLFFVPDPKKKLLQEYLYRLVNESTINASSTVQSVEYAGDFVPKETIKLANTVVSILPIILVYPFLQRHFTKGVMIGAVKG
jgi:putative aldouronate transport system permease protein